MEDKNEILHYLLPALQATRFGRDIVSLEYTSLPGIYDEVVSIKWENGYVHIVNVTADSGITMIKNIIARLIG